MRLAEDHLKRVVKGEEGVVDRADPETGQPKDEDMDKDEDEVKPIEVDFDGTI
jgi:hypothetical protein